MVLMYSQYIREHCLAEIVADSVRRTMKLSVDQAARLPNVLDFATALPVAVACEHLHMGCGFPPYFVFDMFQACLASCQH